MCALGWKSLGVLELTALPSIKQRALGRGCREVDALLVWEGARCICATGCGNPGSPTSCRLRPEAVYVGTSGGAMVATPDFGGETYDDSEPLTGSDEALGLVDFSVFPHLRPRGHAGHALATIERWAAGYRYRRTRSTTRPRYEWSTATCRSRLRGTLEAVHPQPRSELIGQETCALGWASVLSLESQAGIKTTVVTEARTPRQSERISARRPAISDAHSEWDASGRYGTRICRFCSSSGRSGRDAHGRLYGARTHDRLAFERRWSRLRADETVRQQGYRRRRRRRRNDRVLG